MQLLLYCDRVGLWIAQSLEIDLSAFGEDPELAIANWRKVKLFQDYLFWSARDGLVLQNRHAHIRFHIRYGQQFVEAWPYHHQLKPLELCWGEQRFVQLGSDLEIKISP